MTERPTLTLAQLCDEVPGSARPARAQDCAVAIHGVREDSRKVEPGDLYVLRSRDAGLAADYLNEAAARGAVAIMAEYAPNTAEAGVPAAAIAAAQLPRILVQDAAKSLAYAAAALYGHPTLALDVVGITGTNGKTTTTQLLRSAVDGAAGRAVCGVMGTVGYRFGDHVLPSTHTTPGADEVARVAASMRTLGAAYLAMEVSSHALVQERVRAVRFRVAAFTNLTQDHLDFHGNMADYAAAKARLFTELAPGSCVLNIANETGVAFSKLTRSPTLSVSALPATGADVHARTVHADADGLRAQFATPYGVFEFETRMLGLHNLENIAVALGICCALDLPLEAALAGMAAERGVAGRMQRVDDACDEIIAVVDYAHTPDALERVLSALKSTARGKLWCVFGCGGDRDRGKRPLMGAMAAAHADCIVLTNDNPRSEAPAEIAAAVEAGLIAGGRVRVARAADLHAGSYLVELDRAAAIAAVVAAAAPHDVVLVAGKGHETYQIVGTESRHFDDAEELRQALIMRRKPKK
jgi:UDP-N-acetylmuramoyl-L-alanyl-D-glutamate--2,6-diaminopimelate ligase